MSEVPVAGEPSRLEQFAAALAESTCGGSELGMVQLYKVGDGLVPLNRAIVEPDVDPGEIRFVVNPHDHGAESTFVVTVTELAAPADPFPPLGPEEVRPQGVSVLFRDNAGPQLWYGDGHIAYRMDAPVPLPYGPEPPSERDLALMDALLKLSERRVQDLRCPDPK